MIVQLDTRKLSREERQLVKGQIRWYKQYQELIFGGDYYRLTDAEENREFAAWQFVSRDQKASVVSAVCLHARSNPLFWRVRLKGLKEEGWYQVREERMTDEGPLEGKDNETSKRECLICPGSALMYAGVNLPVFWGDYESVRYLVEEVRHQAE